MPKNDNNPPQDAPRKKINIDPFEIIEILTKFINPETAYKEILRFVTETFRADSGQIIVKDLEAEEFEVQAVSSKLPSRQLDFSSSILNEVIETKQPLCIPNAVNDPVLGARASILGKIFLSVISVPILDKDEPIGAIYLDRRYLEKGEFNGNYDLESLQTLANKLTPILWMRRNYDHIQVTQLKSVMQELDVIMGRSRIMRDIYRKLSKYATSDLTLYIHGETGVGKEWLAWAVHRLSHRKNNPFIVIDCTQLSKETAEAELFGSVPGAFTGALNKPGLFEHAQGGTIFLDEIGELPLDVQTKLLRVLEKGQEDKLVFTRKGGHKEIAVDARIIAVTNRNLEEYVKPDTFRNDLLYRLQQLELFVPPLRDRTEDIIPYAIGLLHKANPHNAGITLEAQKVLEAHAWDGNVRELKHRIESAVVEFGCEKPLTSPMLFPKKPFVQWTTSGTHQADLDDNLKLFSSKTKYEVVLAAVKRYGNKTRIAQELGINRQSIYNILNNAPYEKVMEVLSQCRGDAAKAALELEISQARLTKIIRAHQGKTKNENER